MQSREETPEFEEEWFSVGRKQLEDRIDEALPTAKVQVHATSDQRGEYKLGYKIHATLPNYKKRVLNKLKRLIPAFYEFEFKGNVYSVPTRLKYRQTAELITG